MMLGESMNLSQKRNISFYPNLQDNALLTGAVLNIEGIMIIRQYVPILGNR
jgi:hypothetical protein